MHFFGIGRPFLAIYDKAPEKLLCVQKIRASSLQVVAASLFRAAFHRKAASARYSLRFGSIGIGRPFLAIYDKATEKLLCVQKIRASSLRVVAASLFRAAFHRKAASARFSLRFGSILRERRHVDKN